jgi:hypothetical protein
MRKYATRFEPVQPESAWSGELFIGAPAMFASMNPAPAELLQLLKSAALQPSSSPTTETTSLSMVHALFTSRPVRGAKRKSRHARSLFRQCGLFFSLSLRAY